MKRWLVLTGHKIVWLVCPPVPEFVFDWYIDHVYGPWMQTQPSACDDCPLCQEGGV
jgi:hypothetical protein